MVVESFIAVLSLLIGTERQSGTQVSLNISTTIYLLRKGIAIIPARADETLAKCVWRMHVCKIKQV